MRALRPRHLVAAAAGAVALWVAVARPFGLSAEQAAGAALVGGVLALWATAVVPEILTSLLFFLLAMLFVVAPAEVVFSGFHSAANWTVFGGLVIGAAVQTTGLGARIANAFARRFASGYVGVIAGMVAVGVVLSFLMPSSMGRIVLLAPIAMALAERLGFRPGDNGYLGIVLAMGFGTSSPAAGILPANVPNLVLMGGAESVYGVALTYGPYLLLHFPTLGFLKALTIVGVIVAMFPDRPAFSGREATETPASADEKRLGLFLVAALAAWMTDFAHQVSPAWIALAVALACMSPVVGVLPRTVFAGGVNFVPVFLTAAILGVGALVDHVGLGDVIGRRLHAVAGFEPGRDFATFAAVILIDTVAQFLITSPGVAAVMVPLSGSIAEASGLPVATVLNMHVVGYSNYMLPYQMGPLLIVGALCGVPNAHLTRSCLAVGLSGLLVLAPLTCLWWWVLGYLN